MEASTLSPPARLGRRSLSGRLLRLRTDEQLIALFRAGHDEAFRVIHDRYRQRLFSYARQMLGGSPSDADDALQDVFLRAYHALRADDRPITLRAWLYRVAHNRCIDQLRRPVPAPADVFDLTRTPLQDPLAECERREDLRRLVADVARLPEQQRSALLMREMEGLSYAELSGALDVSVPAVKSLLVRARLGLVEAVEARDTACGDIRVELVEAHGRGVRSSGRSRRHLRECAGCREYRSGLRRVERRLNGLSPGVAPLATIAKLLGLGGAGSAGVAGAATGGGAGTATIGTGAAAATASKVVAVVAAAAVVGGGAVEVKQHVVDRAPAPVTRTHAPAVPRTAGTATATPAHGTGAPDAGGARSTADAARGREASGAAGVGAAGAASDEDVLLAGSEADAIPSDVAASSGGVEAPVDDPPTVEPTTADAETRPAVAPHSDTAEEQPAPDTAATAGAPADAGADTGGAASPPPADELSPSARTPQAPAGGHDAGVR